MGNGEHPTLENMDSHLNFKILSPFKGREFLQQQQSPWQVAMGGGHGGVWWWGVAMAGGCGGGGGRGRGGVAVAGG